MAIQPLPAAGDTSRVCISLALPDTMSTVAALRRITDPVDVVEIRLDAMQNPDVAALCEQLDHPLLFTNRPEWEGGRFNGPEEDRLQPLLEAVRCRASFVDLELKTDPGYRERLLDSIRDSTTRLIISHHDFDHTPDSAALEEILLRQVNSGAHIGKIVTTAHDHIDVLNVLHLQSRARVHDFPLIAFCMGEAGRLSRVFTLLLGGFMSYAALGEQQTTAPGQLTARELGEALRMLAAISRPA